MTLQEQQIEFFKWMGWTVFGESHGGFGGKTWGLSPSEGICELPKITLGVLHEAEKRLATEDEVRCYEHHLDLLVGKAAMVGKYEPIRDRSYHATTAQRLESLLRTVGMWKE